MRRKALFVTVLVLALLGVPALVWADNSVSSSTMVFEGTLADNGDGTFSGVLPMVDEAAASLGDGTSGFDLYADEGNTAWFGDDAGSGPVWTSQAIGADHDAWPTWNPDTPDWYQYSLNLYLDGSTHKWSLRNHAGATDANPWYDTAFWGAEKPAQGVPMSGVMDWANLYAEETDTGAYLPSTGTAEIPGGAASQGGGAHTWDMDWSWGSEVVPLEYPGFDVQVDAQGGGIYRVTMTPAAGPVVNANTGESFGTIQAAIDAASAGDTINVAAGTYVEQLEIDKALTIQGAGSGTVVASPDALTKFFATSSNNYPIVYIHDTDGVTLQNLVVDGLGKGNANYRMIGVGFRNAGGTVSEVEIKDVRDTPFSGAQHGVALYVYNDDTVSRTVNVWDCTFVGFQKNALALNAGDTTPLTVDVQRNTITGAGTTDTTAQNGIQVWADLGTGTIAENTITGIAYDGSGWVASSILNYYADLNITGNTITGAHMGIYNIDGAGQINDNDLSILKAAGYAYGIVATDPPYAPPAPFDAEAMMDQAGGKSLTNAPTGVQSVLNVEVANNTLTFVGPDNTASFGIEADGGYGTNDLALNVHDNQVSGFEVGVELYQCQSSCSTGVFTALTVNHNSLAGNTFGIRSNVDYLTADGEFNWWGAADGPSGEGPGSGDAVSTNVDYSPWLGAVPGTTPMTWYTNDSIQAAIDAASAGDTIYVAPGLYEERIVIAKPLTLRGSTHAVPKDGYSVPANYAWDTNVESVISNPDPALTKSQVVYILDTNDVTVEGFVVQSLNALASSSNDHLFTIEASVATMNNIVVRNNVIGPNTNLSDQDGTHGRMGLYININNYGVSYGLTNSTIAHNKIFDCQGNGNNVFLWASYFDYGAPNPSPMVGTVFEYNEIYGSHRSGFETAGGFSDLVLRGNKIYNNSSTNGGTQDDKLKYGHGIVMVRGASDKMAASDHAFGPVNLTLEDNEIYDNEKSGIYFDAKNTNYTLTGNNIHDNGWDGIMLDLEGRFWNGTFEPQPVPPDKYACFDGTSNVVAHSNQFVNNGRNGVEVVGVPTNGFVMDAELNWWGAASGPSGEGPGAGDAVTTYVDYSPWWGDSSGSFEVEAGTSGEIVMPSGSTAAEIQAVMDDAPVGSVIVLPAETIAVPGGFFVPAGITLRGQEGTLIQPSSPCATVMGDDVTLDYLTCDGSGTTDSGVVLDAGLTNVTNLIVTNNEVYGFGDGLHLGQSGGVTINGLLILDNYIHDNSGDGIEFENAALTTSGYLVQIEGNAFRNNGDNGITNNSSSQDGGDIVAEYNEWGDQAGPTGPNGDGVSSTGVDYEPFVFGHLDVDPSTQTKIEGQAATVDVTIDAASLYGVEFDLTFDPALLQLSSDPVVGAFKTGTPGALCIVTNMVDANGSGLIHLYCHRADPDAEYTADGETLLTLEFATQEIATDLETAVLDIDLDSVVLGAKPGVDVFVDGAADGEIKITGATGLTGALNLQGRSDNSGATVDLDLGIAHGFDPGAVASQISGHYDLGSVAADSYLITIEMPRYLNVPLAPAKSIWATGNAVVLSELTLLGGDVNPHDGEIGDLIIDVLDASAIGGAYGTQFGDTGWADNADVNDDGKVDILDLVLVGGNYNMCSGPIPAGNTSAVQAYTSWTP